MTKNYVLKSMEPEDWRRAYSALAGGALACLPNDTVYGVACVPGNAAAVDRIYRLKHRERDKPLAMVFGDTGHVLGLLPEIVPAVAVALDALLPGPVTVVLEARDGRAAALSRALGSPGSLAVRVVPPPLDSVYRRLPSPLALTSANLSGGPDPGSLEEVDPEVLNACEFAIDAGRCPEAAPSTVVDLRPLAAGEKAVILRKGPMSAATVEKLLSSEGLR